MNQETKDELIRIIREANSSSALTIAEHIARYFESINDGTPLVIDAIWKALQKASEDYSYSLSCRGDRRNVIYYSSHAIPEQQFRITVERVDFKEGP